MRHPLRPELETKGWEEGGGRGGQEEEKQGEEEQGRPREGGRAGGVTAKSKLSRKRPEQLGRQSFVKHPDVSGGVVFESFKKSRFGVV